MRLKLPSLTLHIVERGPATASPLLLLHGATETFESGWSAQIAPLSAAFRLIGPDLRGHGGSDNPANRLDLRRMADDMVELLDHLKIRSTHLCGFSGGASVALYLAARHPDRLRSMVLISSNYTLDRRRTDLLDFWNPERIRRERADWWDAMARHHPDPPTLLRWWAAEDRLRPAFTAENLAAITLPALVIAGDRDPIIPLDQALALYDALPDARLAILPATGHGIPSLRPTRLTHLLLDFLYEVEGESRDLE